MQLNTIEMPSLSVRAAFGSVNKDARTVDLIFSTGAAVDRRDTYTGQRYREVLSMDPAHVRLDRLNAGAPLLDSHSGSYSVRAMLGSVQPGSVRIENKQGLATVRFSNRTDVEPVWQDVVDGIIRAVSTGYRVYKFLESAPTSGGILTRTAVDWEPYEVSMVPMPEDIGSRTRGGDKSDTNACEIVVRAIDTSVTTDADRARRLRFATAHL